MVEVHSFGAVRELGLDETEAYDVDPDWRRLHGGRLRTAAIALAQK